MRGLLLLAVLFPLTCAAELLRDGDDARGLLPVPAPDTSRLSDAVRESLAAAEAEFDAIAGELDDESLGIAYGRLGMRYQSHQLDAATVPAYRNAIRLIPEAFRWHYYLGFRFHEAGEFEAALATYDRARDLDGEGYGPLELRAGLAALDAERLDDAERRLRLHGERYGEEAAALAGLAEIAALRSDHAEAVRLYRRALTLQPAADQLNYPLALSLRRIGETEAAAEALAARGDLPPRFADPELSSMQALSRSPAFFGQRGQEALRAERLDEALLMFETAVEIHPDHLAARNALANVLGRLERYDEAQAQYQRALVIAPGNPIALSGLGTLAEIAGDDLRAAQHYDAWVAAGGGAAASLRAGDALLRAGLYDEAAQRFDAARREVGDDPQLLSRRAIAGLAAEGCDAVLTLLATASAPQPLMWRARALATCPARHADERAAAVEMASALVARYPNEATQVTMALALGGDGRYEEAAELVRRILFNAISSGGPAAEATLMQEALAAFEAGEPAPRALTEDGPFLNPARITQ